MIPDVPYRFTIRPLSDDEGGGCIEAMGAEGHLIPRPTRSAAA